LVKISNILKSRGKKSPRKNSHNRLILIIIEITNKGRSCNMNRTISKIQLTEKEQEFFKHLKQFLVEKKSEYENFDITAFYQALLENRQHLDYIINNYTSSIEFIYEPDQTIYQCADTLYIMPFNCKIEFSWYGAYRLQITSNEEVIFEEFIELENEQFETDEEYTDDISSIHQDEIKTHRIKQIKEEIHRIDEQIEELLIRKNNLLKEIA
jgi:hypothetical protein